MLTFVTLSKVLSLSSRHLCQRMCSGNLFLVRHFACQATSKKEIAHDCATPFIYTWTSRLTERGSKDERGSKANNIVARGIATKYASIDSL